MRIEYLEPKLEIIDLLDVDIITSSGDNDFDFDDLLKAAGKALGLTRGNEDWSFGGDNWNSNGSWN